MLAECALSFSVSLCMFIVYLCREAFGPIVGGAIVYNVGFPNMAAVRIMCLLILWFNIVLNKKKKKPWMTSNNHYITLFEHLGSIHVFSGVAGDLVVQALDYVLSSSPSCSRDLVCFGCTQP